MNRWIMTVAILVAATNLQADSLLPEHSGIDKAVVVVAPTRGQTVAGIVTFTRVDNGVRIVAEISGLTPGEHGFHIHQFGDCSAADGTSAGGHFNPHGAAHGGPEAATRHAGDLGNLTADAEGHARYDRVDTSISLNGHDSIVGRGIIVHEKVDDLTTQPTGAAGARVACGVIGIAQE